ncbi:MAG: GNAT family N-acetyltransferase [Mycobacteriaceae bacterium]
MTVDDVPAVVAVQEPGAVHGLANVFPQDLHPFPRDDVAQRWVREISTPDISCYVLLCDDHTIAGFAATRGDELLHFGVALERWGTGTAQTAHDAVIDVMRRSRVRLAWLRVFTGNARARRFYERNGWRSTGERSRSSFAPYPELLRYERPI